MLIVSALAIAAFLASWAVLAYMGFSAHMEMIGMLQDVNRGRKQSRTIMFWHFANFLQIQHDYKALYPDAPRLKRYWRRVAFGAAAFVPFALLGMFFVFPLIEGLVDNGPG